MKFQPPVMISTRVPGGEHCTYTDTSHVSLRGRLTDVPVTRSPGHGAVPVFAQLVLLAAGGPLVQLNFCEAMAATTTICQMRPIKRRYVLPIHHKQSVNL